MHEIPGTRSAERSPNNGCTATTLVLLIFITFPFYLAARFVDTAFHIDVDPWPAIGGLEVGIFLPHLIIASRITHRPQELRILFPGDCKLTLVTRGNGVFKCEKLRVCWESALMGRNKRRNIKRGHWRTER